MTESTTSAPVPVHRLRQFVAACGIASETIARAYDELGVPDRGDELRRLQEAFARVTAPGFDATKAASAADLYYACIEWNAEHPEDDLDEDPGGPCAGAPAHNAGEEQELTGAAYIDSDGPRQPHSDFTDTGDVVAELLAARSAGGDRLATAMESFDAATKIAGRRYMYELLGEETGLDNKKVVELLGELRKLLRARNRRRLHNGPRPVAGRIE